MRLDGASTFIQCILTIQYKPCMFVLWRTNESVNRASCSHAKIRWGVRDRGGGNSHVNNLLGKAWIPIAGSPSQFHESGCNHLHDRTWSLLLPAGVPAPIFRNVAILNGASSSTACSCLIFRRFIHIIKHTIINGYLRASLKDHYSPRPSSPILYPQWPKSKLCQLRHHREILVPRTSRAFRPSP